MSVLRIIATAVLLFASLGLAAQPYDAVVGGTNTGCLGIVPRFIPQLEWLGDEPLIEFDAEASTIAPAPGGAIYGIGGARDIVRVRRGSPDSVIATMPTGHIPIALVADAAGNIYVRTASGANSFIVALERDGTFRTMYALGGVGVSGAIDLAADQCTLFLLTTGGVVRRFNVCTGTFLTDFAAVPGARSLRILPDGGVIVAAGDELVRLNAAGTETRRYTRPEWSDIGGLGLANGGTTLWLAEEGCEEARTADHIDLGTGVLLATHSVNMDNADSVVPWQAWTAAIGSGGAIGAEAVPTASVYALMTLVALLVLAAMRRIA